MPQHFKDLHTLYKTCNLPPLEHPLLSVFSFDSPLTAFSEHLDSFTCDFYLVAFKKIKDGVMLYGRSKYDHQNGTMSFTRPGQRIELKNVEFEKKGFVIIFHQDYILSEPIFDEINDYGFFDYDINEALHISEKEETIMWDLFQKLEMEYQTNQDECSKPIILSHILSILRYANRYYKRQFRDRHTVSSNLLSKFNKILKSKLESEANILPSVNEIAQSMGLSSNYLSDLLKSETGKTTIEHIHIAIINKAKNLLLSSDYSISETAYSLGFEHPSYFSRLFKKQTGLSPKEYRQKVN